MKQLLVALGIVAIVVAGLAYGQVRKAGENVVVAATGFSSKDVTVVWIIEQTTGSVRFCSAGPQSQAPYCSPSKAPE